MLKNVVRGVAAGAAGTVALNVATYLDMAIRGRGSSSTPAETAGKLADKAGIDLAADGEGPDSDTAANRRSGLGSLMGYVTGLGVGGAYGALRSTRLRPPVPAAATGLTVAASAGSVAPMTLLGVTDPRQWGAQSWIMDLIPHLAYGLVTAAVYEGLMTD